MPALCDLIGRATLDQISDKKRKDPEVSEVRGALSRIQLLCEKLELDVGEGLRLININFGYFSWAQIPSEKEDEIMQWITNNHWRRFRILSPGKHDTLMTVPYGYINEEGVDMSAYRVWYEDVEKRCCR
jgi:hypothetical protein